MLFNSKSKKAMLKIAAITLCAAVLETCPGVYMSAAMTDDLPIVFEDNVIEGEGTSGVKWELVGGKVLTVYGSGEINGKETWGKYASDVTELNIGNGITHIEAAAFDGFDSLRSVTLPFCGTERDAEGDNGCFACIFGAKVPDGLDTVVITDTEKIEKRAFFGCSGIKKLVIRDGVKVIDREAFALCSGLTSFDIPDSVIYLGELAFYGDTSITELNIGEGLEYIPYGAFACMTGIKSIVVPNSVETIEYGAFAGCSGLESISLPFVGKSRSASGPSGTFGCIFSQNVESTHGSTGVNKVTLYNGTSSFSHEYTVKNEIENRYIHFINGSLSETEKAWYTWDGGFEKDGVNARYYNVETYIYDIPENLETVYITDGVQISEGAFNCCRGIRYLSLNEGITDIGSYAFAGMNLPGITVPGTVASMESRCFDRCCEELTVYSYEDTFGTAYAKKNGIKNTAVYIKKEQNVGITFVADILRGIKAAQITEGRVFDIACGIYGGRTAVYGIDLVDEYGKKTETEYAVTINVPIPSEFERKSVRVWRIEDDGKCVNVCAKLTDAGMMFNINSSGYYAVAEGNEPDPDSGAEEYKTKYRWNSGEWQIVNVSSGESIFDSPTLDDGTLVTGTDMFDHVKGEEITDFSAGEIAGIAHTECTECGIILGARLITEEEHGSDDKADIKVKVNVGGAKVVLSDGGSTVIEKEADETELLFDDIPCGEYILTVSRSTYVTRKYSVTLGESGETVNAVINRIGDVTGDGQVNSRDLSRLYAHVNETSLLEGYLLECADGTNDKKANSRDLSRLYAHVNESSLLFDEDEQ